MAAKSNTTDAGERAEPVRLLEKSEDIVRIMKRRRWNHVLVAVALFLGFDAVLLILRLAGAPREAVNSAAAVIMPLNGVISAYCLVEPLFKAHIAIGVMKKGMAKLRSGEFSSFDKCENTFLRKAGQFASCPLPYFLFLSRERYS